jgi:hypothetical protein
MSFYRTNSQQKINFNNYSSQKKIPKNKEKSIPTQIEQLLDKSTINVVIEDKKAYWVFENCFYQASIDEGGRIETENAVKIDPFSLSETETKKLFLILDSISE